MTTNSKEYARKYYAEHKEMFREASKRYQEKKKLEKRLKVTNPRLFDLREDYKTPTKEDFRAVPARISSYNKEYYEKNKERIRMQQKESRKRKRAAEKRKIYYEANREKILEQQRKYSHKKYREKKLSKTFLWRIRLKLEKIFG